MTGAARPESIVATPDVEPTVRARGFTRRLVAAGCVFAAYVALARHLFTTDHLIGVDTWWTALVRATRFGMPAILTMTATTAAIAGPRLARSVAALAPSRLPPLASCAVVHLATVLAWFGITAVLLGPGVEAVPAAGLIAITWGVVGLAVVSSLAAFALPLPAQREIVRRNAGWLALGVATGLGVFWLGDYLLTTMPGWEPLGDSTLQASYALLRVFESDAILDPSERLLGTASFRVIITQYCSGYQFIVIWTAVFGVVLSAWHERFRMPHALLLLPLGIALLWTFNVLRITALMLIGTYSSPTAALEGFHTNIGWWVLSLGVLICLFAGMHVPYFARARVPRTARTVNVTAVYLAPLVAATATTMLVRAVCGGPIAIRSLSICAAVAVVLVYRREYRPLLGRPTAFAIWYGVAASLCWLLLRESGAAPTSPWIGTQPLGIASLVVQVAGYTLVTPFVEELAFRGFLLRRLESADFEAVDPMTTGALAIFGSSLVFGLLHGAAVAGFVIGILYALVYRARGRLADAIAAHVMTNALLVAIALATGNEQWMT